MKNKNILWTVLGLTALAKALEWMAQYSIYKMFTQQGTVPSIPFSKFFYVPTMIMQMSFILLVALSFYFLFSSAFGVKKKSVYLLIPVLAYFTKEVWNFIFVYNFTINLVTITALILEPLFLYGIIWTINKSALKWK